MLRARSGTEACFWNGPSRLSAKMRPALAWEIRLLGDQLGGAPSQLDQRSSRSTPGSGPVDRALERRTRRGRTDLSKRHPPSLPGTRRLDQRRLRARRFHQPADRRADPERIDEMRRYARGEAYDEQPVPELDSEAISLAPYYRVSTSHIGKILIRLADAALAGCGVQTPRGA